MATTGTYHVRADIEAVFGAENVKAWGNMGDDTATVIDARVQTAIDTSEQMINDRFRGSMYTVPLIASGSNGLTPVTDWAAKLSGVWLYMNRGFDDTDAAAAEATRLQAIKNAVLDEIDDYLAGARRLLCDRSTSGPQAPVVVK